MTRRCLVPRWLVITVGSALVPWAVWVTYSLIRHDVWKELTDQRIERLEK